MKPIVGITAWRRELNTFLGPEMLQTLSTYYSDAVVAAGMTPIILPGGQHPGEANHLVSLVDGVLISGGDDIDPETYGAEVTGAYGHHRDVDRFEIAVVQAAQEQGKPVLAICRGLQLLNVALGGTIGQEITSEGGVHELISTDAEPSELNDRRHPVHLEEDSLLASIYAGDEVKVNTLHHQGIDMLAPELAVEGRAPDGLIEAARCPGSWWALGVQWHPERMGGDHHAPLFTAFREAIEAG